MRLTVAAIAVALVVHLQSQGPTQPPVVSSGTVGVLIDVTVLDRNGRPVMDLGVDDFELTEDGGRQQILAATPIQRGAAPSRGDTSGTTPAASTAVSPVASPGDAPAAARSVEDSLTITAILFDRLSSENRAASRTAALTYVSTLVSSRDYAGIFVADLALKIVQPFSNDQGKLRLAVDRVAGMASANLDTAHLSGRHAPALDPNQPATAGAESSAGFVSAAERERYLKSLDPVERKLAEMELRMEEGYRQLASEISGDASLAGISAAVDALAPLPGRKSILYFTDNLEITSRLKPRFEALIGAANRSNVTIYPVDAAGLRVHSREAEVGRNVDVAGAQGTGASTRGDGPWTKDLERQEQVLSSRPGAALGRLAKETGGFLLENTNNLAAGVARIQQERTNYYLLAYQSTRPGLDGKFRKVNVKVKRANVMVKARSGYLAVPSRQP